MITGTHRSPRIPVVTGTLRISLTADWLVPYALAMFMGLILALVLTFAAYWSD